MKKIAPVLLLFLCAVLAWNVFVQASGMRLDFDGEHLDGPLETLLALSFAGGGLMLASLAVLFVGALLTVVFAGLGMLLALGLALAALTLAALVSPLLLPLLIPAAIIWFFVRRNRLKTHAA